MIEGDTPSFLSLMNNGLASYMNPTFGGWGGRYIWRQPWLESRPYWTNGRNSRDTVVGTDGKSYTSDQATIWRWREAYMHDFAARIEWSVAEVGNANHNPDVTVNGQPGKAPIALDVTVGTPVKLDASESRDRDGHTLKYSWSFYAEAGSGMPGRGGGRGAGRGEPARAGGGGVVAGIPPAPAGGRTTPQPRVTITDAGKAVATVTPNSAGVAHVILAVTDNGTPSLASYRRIIFTIQAGRPR